LNQSYSFGKYNLFGGIIELKKAIISKLKGDRD